MSSHLSDVADTNNIHQLSAWRNWINLSRAGVSSEALGACHAPDSKRRLQRFAARYRVAHAFQSLQLDGFSDRTLAGYTSLVRVMLVWSAAEQFLTVLGKNPPIPSDWFAEDAVDVVMRKIRCADPTLSFYAFVHEHLERGPRGRASRMQLDRLRGEKPMNPSYLASTVRHVFAHGCLTSMPKGVTHRALLTSCNEVGTLLLATIDGRFSRLVARVSTMRRAR